LSAAAQCGLYNVLSLLLAVAREMVQVVVWAGEVVATVVSLVEVVVVMVVVMVLWGGDETVVVVGVVELVLIVVVVVVVVVIVVVTMVVLMVVMVWLEVNEIVVEEMMLRRGFGWAGVQRGGRQPVQHGIPRPGVAARQRQLCAPRRAGDSCAPAVQTRSR
jgi:hypothetical protein